MTSPVSLIELGASIILDTSAAINLSATGCCSQVLAAVQARCVVSEALLSELQDGARRGKHELEEFSVLIDSGNVEVASFDTEAEAIFETLVAGSAVETLGDGEAATIALALARQAVPVIDERKATSLCHRKFPALKLSCTLDLLAHPATFSALGAARLKDAVTNALQKARMRVPPRFEDWTVGLIGRDAAATCHSLSRRARSL